MRVSDLARLSLRTFKARTGRTLLTILGMGIGISAILFLVGLGYGLQELLLRTITTSDSLSSLDIAASSENGARLTPDKAVEISHLQGVVDIAPAYDLPAQIKYSDTVTDATATVTKPLFLLLDGKKISQGVSISDGGGRNVVLATAFAKIFQTSSEEMLGKNVNFSLRVPAGGAGSENSQKIDIADAYKIVGFIESEDLVFFANSEDLKTNIGPIDYSRLKIKCVDSSTLETLRQKITDQGFTVSSLSDTVREVNRVFSGIKIVLAFFGLIALAVSAIGMFNTMTVALLERTKEIGVMKAIGASNLNILSMFIFESTAMGFLGGICGVILGILSGSVFNFLINFIAVRFGGKAISLFYYPAWFVLFVLGFSIFIGFLTGIAPARRASTIDPLDALMSR